MATAMSVSKTLKTPSLGFTKRSKKPDPQLIRDIETFRNYARALGRGGSYDKAISDFSLHLRQRGSEMADESVQVVRAKPTDAEGKT